MIVRYSKLQLICCCYPTNKSHFCHLLRYLCWLPIVRLWESFRRNTVCLKLMDASGRINMKVLERSTTQGGWKIPVLAQHEGTSQLVTACNAGLAASNLAEWGKNIFLGEVAVRWGNSVMAAVTIRAVWARKQRQRWEHFLHVNFGMVVQ